MMKVAVLGAGAVGSMMGGLIKHGAPDVEVLLFARGEHREAMRQQGGVVLRGPWGNARVPVPVADHLEELRHSDFVLPTVKSPATEAAIRSAADHLGNAIVVSMALIPLSSVAMASSAFFTRNV